MKLIAAPDIYAFGEIFSDLMYRRLFLPQHFSRRDLKAALPPRRISPSVKIRRDRYATTEQTEKQSLLRGVHETVTADKSVMQRRPNGRAENKQQHGKHRTG